MGGWLGGWVVNKHISWQQQKVGTCQCAFPGAQRSRCLGQAELGSRPHEGAPTQLNLTSLLPFLLSLAFSL